MSRAISTKAVQTEVGFIGTIEVGGNNYGTQVEHFLASVGLSGGNPWCAAFQYHCLNKSAGFLGLHLPTDFPKSGYCPDFAHWAKQTNNWHTVDDVNSGAYTPQPGDLVCYYFKAMGRIAHIGMLETWTGGSKGTQQFTTIEGNTSDPTGVNRDGDGVYRKHRVMYEMGTFGGFVSLNF